MSEWAAAEADLETRLRKYGIPVALAVAYLFVKVGVGHFLLRTFLSMWVHELGHATTAWMCGYLAFPGPWLTPTANDRSPMLALLLFAALAGGAFWFWRTGRRGVSVALGCLALGRLHAAGTGVPHNDSTAAVLFDKACEGGEAAACVQHAMSP